MVFFLFIFQALVWGRNTPKKSARYLAAACFLVAVNYIGGMFIVGGSNGYVAYFTPAPMYLAHFF